MDKKTDTITISKKEYKRLKGDSDFLQALEVAGVDNWDGYSDAIDFYEETENNA